jgi:hypothetical protein
VRQVTAISPALALPRPVAALPSALAFAAAVPGASALWQASYRRRDSFPDAATIGLSALEQIVKADQDVDLAGTKGRRKEPNAITQARLVRRLAVDDDARAWNPRMTCQGCGPRTRTSLDERGVTRMLIPVRMGSFYGFWKGLIRGLPFSTMNPLIVLLADSGLDSCTTPAGTCHDSPALYVFHSPSPV